MVITFNLYQLALRLDEIIYSLALYVANKSENR